MGGKTTTSTNKVTIPKEVLDRYNAVNAQAAKVAENPFQKYGTTQEDFVAQFNEQQLKGVQGINDVAGMGAVYENVDKYLNPYTKNVADTTRAQMEQANEQAQSGALGTAVQSGAFGGDRAGVAAANLSNQQNLAMGSTMANIYNQGYTQAIDTSMNDRNRMLGVAGAQLGAGTQMQQTEQAGLDALINQFQQEQGYPFQVAQFLANIAMGTGALSGSTTTGTQMAPFFSDRRLKHDIKKIGEADNGLPIYTFKYKGDENQQTHVGFMADEVEKKNPDAVGLDPSGYKTVDYDKAAKGEGFADGGVAGPYGSKVGQGVGVGSYVPQAYLPVGELMVADPSFAQQSQANFLDTLNSAATAGESVLKIRNLLRDPDAKQPTKESVAPAAAGNIQEFEPPRLIGGGAGGFAEGGGVKPQLHGDYLSTTLAAQEAGKDKKELMTAGQQGQPKTGFENVATGLGAIASIASLFPSDRRLKHDIKRIGKTEKGLPIYTFKYKGDNREQTHVGFMADEVERKNPEAVGERNGYKTVDYSQAHKFATGGVAGRHGYALDGTVEERVRDAMRATAANENNMRLTRDEIPAVQTLGSLPDARVVAADQVRPIPRPTGLVPTSEPTDLAPAADQVRPMARPAGLVPAAASIAEQIPPARPEGLAPAAVKPMARPVGLGRNTFDIDRLASTFRLQESGSRDGNYSAIGQPVRRGDGVDYAYGAYGIMGANIPSWTEEVLGTAMTPDEFLLDQEAQDKVAKAKLAEYHARYGNIEDVASTWFSGRPLEGNTSVDPTSGKSVPSYVSDISNAYYGAGNNGLAGGTGGDRLSLSTRGEGQEGDVKPYDKRNTLGKMVYDRDGKVNRDAMLSLFAGLGDMLTSPSPFLLPSIGAGVAGAARTYMAREEQVADIQNTKLDMMKKIREETDKYNLVYGTNYTPEEYRALALNLNTPPPAGETGTGSSSFGSFMGVPLHPMGRNMSDLITLSNGQKIEAGNSLEYLTALKNSMSDYLAIGGVLEADYVRSIDEKIANITTNRGFVPGFDKDGNPVTVQDPAVMTQIAGAAGGTSTIESNVEYANSGNQFFRNYATADANIDRMSEELMKFDAGTLSPTRSNLTSLLASMFPEKGLTWAEEILGPVGDDAAAYQRFQKEAAAFLRSELGETVGSGEAPATVIGMLGDLTPNATMNPQAIYSLLLYSKAALNRKKEYYAARDPSDPTNFFKFVQEFDAANPMEDSVKDAMREMLPQTYRDIAKSIDPNISDADIEKNWLGMSVDKQGLYFSPPDGGNE